MTGISKSHLNYIEKREKEPSLSMAVRIAHELNIKIEELYKVIPQHKSSAILFFIKENTTFIKYPPQWTRFSISVHQEFQKRRLDCMKNVVLNEVKKELFYIQEDIYQNIRKKMNKKDNYFSEKEMKNIEEITLKLRLK